MSRRAFEVVDAFERAVAEYTGAPYAVAVDSCTNALFLCFVYRRLTEGHSHARLPKRTYVGVAQAARNAGLEIVWHDQPWAGWYGIPPLGVIDAARRFRAWMYSDFSYMPSFSANRVAPLVCVSFQATKILPIGRGGAILSDDGQAVEWLRRARFDGRTEGVAATHDRFTAPGWHMYMPPDDAARGLWLMNGLAKVNADLPNDDYPDLSEQPIFR